MIETRLNRIQSKCFCILLLLQTAGCAFIDSPILDPDSSFVFVAGGRVAAKVDGKSYSAKFSWKSSKKVDNISIFSFLGNSIAHIKVRGEKFTLKTNDGKVFRTGSAEEVTSRVLGWSLPVSGLKYWITGNVDPHKPSSIRFLDGSKRPLELLQDGWRVEYGSYLDESTLPKKILLSHKKMKLRIIIDKWVLRKAR